MKLKIRRLKLSAVTSRGLFGSELYFNSGLVVLRADNTSGKSTCIQSIIYALGLEPMLTARHTAPLPPAMTSRIMGEDGNEESVLESNVMLEIENGDGRVATILRWVKHEKFKQSLVSTWDGPALTHPGGAYTQRDFFVRLKGSPTSEAGFHRFLVEFIGWDLPSLVKSDGSEVPLYPELIFPLIFVEQKRGWSGIQAQFPMYPGLPEPRKRAIEFLLALEVYRRIRERIRLKQDLQRIETEWQSKLDTFAGALKGLGVVIQGIPRELTLHWPPAVAPQLLKATDDGWRDVNSILLESREQLAYLVEQEIPTAEAASEEISKRLTETQRLLSLANAALAELAEEVRLDEEQLNTLGRQIEALGEDRRRNEDARTLQRLGSHMTLGRIEGECPTCHQQLPATLLQVDRVSAPMSIDDNITFIDEQLVIFESMRREIFYLFNAKKERLAALRERASQLRRQIRIDKETLTSPAGSPSIAAVQRLIWIRETIEQLDTLNREFLGFLDELGRLSNQAEALKSEMEALPEEELTPDDERRLKLLEASILSQLNEYTFSSFPVERVEISRVSYLPNREGFDLGFDLSASDWIRLIWAYLLGLLEVARAEKTNHPHLLVFDEPRQQEAAEVSFAALLQRAASAGRFGQQIIFATSEPEESLREMLKAVDYQYLSFEGKILKPVSEDKANW